MKGLLIILCLLLGGLIYYQVKLYPQNEENTSVSNKEPINENEPTQNLQINRRPLQAYAEIVDRPLFAANRRPPAQTDIAVVESIDIGELEDLVLFGVVISGETKYAILNNSKEDTTEQVKEGHRYKGWRVSKIFPDSIKFQGEEAEYQLFISPDEKAKKNGLRDRPQIKRQSKSVIRNANQRRKSPIVIPQVQSAGNADDFTDDELDPELMEELERIGGEGGFNFDLDSQFQGFEE